VATEASAVLTEESTVTCGHQGSVTPTGIGRLKVNGNPVLVEASLADTPVSASCNLTPSSDSGGIIAQKCTSVTGVTSEKAGKLKVRTPAGIRGVLMDPLAGTTNGINNRLGTADLSAKPVQKRLKVV
jgi:hypothetical protein